MHGDERQPGRAAPGPGPGSGEDGPQHAESRREGGAGRIESVPGIARIAAGAWVRTASWTVGGAVRAGRRVTHAAITGESPLGILSDARDEVLGAAQRALGVTDLQKRLGGLVGEESEAEPLRARGYALLNRSSELTEHGEGHPAYARILSELAPDEARILRLLATEGPQAAVDVRTWRPLDVGSTVVAPGLTMIAVNAGCRHRERVPAYLSNLFRLGLIWFTRDELADPSAYQVLEAQPDVLDAVKATGRARIVRRSIRLTPFGGHFCQYCLPLEAVDTGEFEAVVEGRIEAAGAEYQATGS